jgi:hypothetical protein
MRRGNTENVPSISCVSPTKFGTLTALHLILIRGQHSNESLKLPTRKNS